MTRSSRRPWLVACIAAIVLLMFTPAEAEAHSGGAVVATNYRTTLHSITPAFVGDVKLSVVDLGDRLQLVNRSDQEVIVLGYDGEPYLRISNMGVWENNFSPAAYLNQSQDASNQAPAFVDSKKTPEWNQVSRGNTYQWHDHRSHWMGKADPPLVRSDPGSVHMVIPRWDVTFRQGAQTVVASGDVQWIPGHSKVLTYLVVLGSLMLALALGLASRKFFGSGWVRRLIVTLAVVILIADASHIVGVVAAGTGTTTSRLSDGVALLLPSLLAWTIGFFGVKRLLRREEAAAWFLTLAGLIVTLSTAFSLSDLHSSQVQFAGPGVLDRILVAVVFACASCLTIIGFVRLWRLRAFQALAHNKPPQRPRSTPS